MLKPSPGFGHGHAEFPAGHGLQLAALFGSRAVCSPLLSFQIQEISLQFAPWATTSSSDWEPERGGPEKAVPVADRGRAEQAGRGQMCSS